MSFEHSILGYPTAPDASPLLKDVWRAYLRVPPQNRSSQYSIFGEYSRDFPDNDGTFIAKTNQLVLQGSHLRYAWSAFKGTLDNLKNTHLSDYAPDPSLRPVAIGLGALRSFQAQFNRLKCLGITILVFVTTLGIYRRRRWLETPWERFLIFCLCMVLTQYLVNGFFGHGEIRRQALNVQPLYSVPIFFYIWEGLRRLRKRRWSK